MKKCSSTSLVIAILMLTGSSAFGQDDFQLSDASVEPVSFMGGDGGCDMCCDDGCDKGCGGLYFDAEALLFRFNTSQGAPIGREFDHELAPRISVGYVGCSGLGLRVRYFDFSHDSNQDAVSPTRSGRILVDTFTLDAELFQDVEIGCTTTLEWSGGVRYNDFKLQNGIMNAMGGSTGAEAKFSGWGVVFGAQLKQQVWRGSFYGRARWAILQSESEAISRNQNNPDGEPVADLARMQTEVAIGYEISRCTNFGVVTARIGYEHQFWDQYASSITTPAFVLGDDISFDGLVLGLELAR